MVVSICYLSDTVFSSVVQYIFLVFIWCYVLYSRQCFRLRIVIVDGNAIVTTTTI